MNKCEFDIRKLVNISQNNLFGILKRIQIQVLQTFKNQFIKHV